MFYRDAILRYVKFILTGTVSIWYCYCTIIVNSSTLILTCYLQDNTRLEPSWTKRPSKAQTAGLCAGNDSLLTQLLQTLIVLQVGNRHKIILKYATHLNVGMYIHVYMYVVCIYLYIYDCTTNVQHVKCTCMILSSIYARHTPMFMSHKLLHFFLKPLVVQTKPKQP